MGKATDTLIEHLVLSLPNQDEPEPPPSELLTKWEVFEKARLIPVWIACRAYQPVHRGEASLSCHSKLLLQRAILDAAGLPIKGKFVDTAHPIIDHLDHGHLGGYRLMLKVADVGAKPWGGWAQLRDARLEIMDLRCGVCEKEFPLSIQHFRTHLRSHPGATKAHQREYLGQFNMTVSRDRPLSDNPDD